MFLDRKHDFHKLVVHLHESMRPVSTILAISLAANLGLAVVWTFTNPARNSSILPAARHATHPAKSGGGANEKDNPAVFVPARFAGAFNAGDAAVLFAQLKALGVSDTRAGDITNRFIWLKYDTRRRELLGLKNTDPNALTEREAAAQLTAAERRELRDLANQASRESLEILGAATVDGIEAISRRYSFLPPGKVAQLQYLQRDYAEMREAITGESARFPLPSDAKQLKILDEEFRKDLAGTLTPEELADYDSRFSDTATRLRHAFAGIDLSDAEFRAIYDASAPIANADSANMSAEQRRELSEAARQSGEAIARILGAERVAAQQRTSTSDYRILLAAADRFNLPAETINGVFDLRFVASSESQRIAADSTLSLAEKQQSLQALAEDIRSRVRAQLGDEIGNACLQRGMGWIDQMSAGNGVFFNAAGLNSTYPIGDPSKGTPKTRRTISRPSKR